MDVKMRRLVERRSFLTIGASALASVVFAGCPSPNLAFVGPEKGVRRKKFEFYNQVVGRTINSVVFYPAGKNNRNDTGTCPLLLITPGFLDTSYGLEYLAWTMTRECGFYSIVFDPDDAINILPQGGGWFSHHLPETLENFMLLKEQLEAIGYHVPASTSLEMLRWFYTALDGDITNQEVLAICQQAFDYRLTDAESIIWDCLDKKYDLPSKELICRDEVYLAGHSLGGFTSLQLAGAGGQTNLPDGLVKATLVMAPAVGFYTPADLQMVQSPTLWLTAGQEREGLKSPIEKLFPSCPEPTEKKVYPWFEHADFSMTFDYLYQTGEEGWRKKERVMAAAVKFFRRWSR